ncbi:MAG TPA: sugar-binding protein [Bryobacteraceae bacterium]|nr:sugar-binding protein [Bryobacteraceae bacterium]
MRTWAALVAAGLIAAHVCAAASPYPWAHYYATKRTRPLAIDGDLADWNGVPVVRMAEEKFFFVGQGMSSAKWQGVRDLAAEFRAQWDENYLYLAVAVTDDRVTEPHGSLAAGTDTGSWDDDGIELMLDNDGCGTARYYIGDPLHHEFHFVYSATHPFVFDNFWVPKPGAPPPMFPLPDGSSEPLAYPGEAMAKNDVTAVFSRPPYSGAYAFKRTAAGYNLELRIALPGVRMAAVNEGGAPIGFDLAVNDNDAGSGPLKQQLHWSGMNGLFWRNCQLFGTLVLINR